MAINLEKGGRADIAFPKFTVGLGWDVNESDTGYDFDLDASAFIVGKNGKILEEEYFVFYNNLESPDGALKHTGDNLTGEGEGDDEQIVIDLSKINPLAEEIIFCVTIHKASERKQNFGQVRNAYIRIFNTDTQEEELRYDLDEDYSVETAIEFGRLYKRNGRWRFEAIGTGRKGGLEDYLKKYHTY